MDFRRLGSSSAAENMNLQIIRCDSSGEWKEKIDGRSFKYLWKISFELEIFCVFNHYTQLYLTFECLNKLSRSLVNSSIVPRSHTAPYPLCCGCTSFVDLRWPFGVCIDIRVKSNQSFVTVFLMTYSTN